MKIFNWFKKKTSLSALKNEIWCEDAASVAALFAEIDLFEKIDPKLAAEYESARAEKPKYHMDGSTAVVPIHGHILREVPWVFDAMGIQATSTTETEKAIGIALRDPAVSDIRLDINSPGGTVGGVDSLAIAVSEGKKIKAINVEATDQISSAAYWIGSQATRIDAERTTKVGSLGAFSAVNDSSKAAEAQGVKVHVLRSGEHKGVGVPGAEITESQLGKLQTSIDSISNMFVESVALGRGKSKEEISKLATGEAWLASEALKLGLIDGIISSRPQTQQADTTISAESVSNEGKLMDKEMEDRLAKLEATISQLSADKAKADARAEVSESALKSVREDKKKSILASGVASGRITPGMVAKVEKYAEICGDDVEALDEFIKGLPVLTRSNPQGKTAAEQNESAAMDASDREVARVFDMDAAIMKAGEEILSATSDGYLRLANGTKVKSKKYFASEENK